MKLKVIGFCGPKNSGKTTMANAIKTKYRDYDIKEFTFSGPLKRSLEQIYGLPLDAFENREFKEKTTHVQFTRQECKRFLVYLSENYLPIENVEEILDKFETLTCSSWRNVLQEVGTKVVRSQVGENYWCDVLYKQVRSYNRRCIVSDVRFKNEIETVKKLGGKVIYVDRPSSVVNDQHASEQAHLFKEECSVILTNEGPLWQVLRDLYLWYSLSQ